MERPGHIPYSFVYIERRKENFVTVSESLRLP
jgi:hypothetical protein